MSKDFPKARRFRSTLQNQSRQLRGFAREEGYQLAGEYVDHESGRKEWRERSGFDAVFEAAENREFDLLIFWSLDRFSREGIRKTVGYLQQLEHLGVRFRFYTEPYLSPRTSWSATSSWRALLLCRVRSEEDQPAHEGGAAWTS